VEELHEKSLFFLFLIDDSVKKVVLCELLKSQLKKKNHLFIIIRLYVYGREFVWCNIEFSASSPISSRRFRLVFHPKSTFTKSNDFAGCSTASRRKFARVRRHFTVLAQQIVSTRCETLQQCHLF